MIVRIALLTLFFCLARSSFGQTQPPHPATNLEAAILNAEAVRSGDVLIRVVRSSDATRVAVDGGLRGALLDETEYVRLLFDYDQDLIVCYSHLARSLTTFRASAVLEEASDFWSAASRGSDRFARFNNSSSKARQLVPWSELTAGKATNATLGFRDVRGLWLTGNLRFGSFSSSRKTVGILLAVAEDNYKIRTSDKALQLKMKTSFNGLPGARNFTINLESLMPETYSTYVRLQEGRELERFEYRKTLWRDYDGTHVPLVFKDELVRTIVPAGSDKEKSISGLVLTKMDFHWFSINEKIDLNLLGENAKLSSSNTLKMVDPVGSGAFESSSEDEQPKKSEPLAVPAK